jgi:mono/diheme cytochrome c family protein
MHSALLSRVSSLLLALLAAVACSVQAQPAPGPTAAPTRGRLLYDAHCIECHNAQVHWRSLSQARDWSSLLDQVNRWQAAAKLAWSDDDVVEVTRHLNDTIYKFPVPQKRASR